MKPLKVMTILGTRPEIIRLSRVINRLESHCEHVLVHTGQNWDHELNQVFFDDLELRAPDHYLGVDVSSLGATVGGILVEVEKVLLQERPDAVLILGDTNSAIAAYMARRMKIPVYHMEAGNRCFDRNVPEETNRKMVDHLSDFNLAYTEHARRNLIAEGLAARRIHVTGSPMYEVLSHFRHRIEASDILASLDLVPNKYLLVSLHREENVDRPENLESLVGTLNRLAEQHQMPVVVSTHPRTRKRLDALQDMQMDERVLWLKPFGFHDYNHLQQCARCVVSDSGTIAEESSMLGFAAVTPRVSIERPEAMDTGAIIVCGLESDNIVRAVSLAIAAHENTTEAEQRALLPDSYQVANTSWRVVKLIVGTARLSNRWDGIVENR